MDEPTRGSRRRLLLVVAIGAVIVAGIVAAAVFVQSGEPVRSVSATCERLAEAKDLDRSLTSLDPITLRDRLDSLEAAGSVAPAEIEPQIATLASFVRELVDQVDRQSQGDRRAALAAALSERADRIDAITAAGDMVQAWASSNCGIELGDASTPSSAP
ncbi:MAG: hypothetical protein EBX39_09390 [Actinobacteria bacterium]|nr:hypothetical protein [Actinomycetota bacterium]